MGEEDVQKGLYCSLFPNEIKNNKNNLTDEEKTRIFVKNILDLKLGKKIVLCKKKISEFIQDIDNDASVLKNYLKSEKRDCMYLLNQWEPLVESVVFDPDYYGEVFVNEEYGEDRILEENFQGRGDGTRFEY